MNTIVNRRIITPGYARITNPSLTTTAGGDRRTINYRITVVPDGVYRV